ncbi:DUF1178 family protein [Sphingomonas rubra]|uniref:Uncharacterized protein n=1 Tax=Sphingomonas rubra TaxID=634430 RepID=A0A1I5PSK1_9SPHN|nr:DUF1178 family protein [Sphingomonas rubra]SFP36985.1 hypothetical protein SAMN04488241_101199 [Sphingomonas rubra]
MIVFDLRCGDGHVFEAWFASGAAYDEQRTAKLLACPICGADDINKAVMAPAVPTKGNRQPSPAAMKQMIGALAAAQAKVLSGSEWVGSGFASRARAMHAGDEPHATIHGQATREEARALIDDGVPVAPLPLPVVPPKQVN